MGTSTDSLNSKLGIDTTDFKTGLDAANRELRILESGFRASVSTMDSWANTVTGLELREKNLTEQIDIQTLKVEKLRDEHERLVAEKGKSSIAAKTSEEKLNKENERLGKMQVELKNTVTGLNNLRQGNESVGKSTDDLEKKQESFGQIFKSSWTELNSLIGVGKMAYQALKSIIDDTVGSYVKYADQVREIVQVTGESAENTSRLLQLTDDYKIDADSLTKVMKKMATEGYAFTTEAIAQLSDEYLKLNPGIERQLFLNQKFGVQGAAFAEIMLQGGDAIRSQSDAISENLILTQESLDKAREYEIAQDNLSDSWNAFKMSIGETTTPMLTSFLNKQNLWIRGKEAGLWWWNGFYIASKSEAELLAEVTEAEKAHKLATEGSAGAVDQLTNSTESATQATDLFGYAVADGVDALKQANAEFNFIISYAKQYETNLRNVNNAEDALKEAEADLFAMSQPGWKGTKEQLETAQEKVDGLKEKLDEAKQASIDATNEMIAGFLQAQLSADGAFTEDDMQKVLLYRLKMGLLTQEAYAAAQNALQIANNLAGIPKKIDVVINVQTNYSVARAVDKKIENLDEYGAIPQADGGDWIVRKPTLFLAGESGTERATFTPASAGMDRGMAELISRFDKVLQSLDGNSIPMSRGAGSSTTTTSESYQFFGPVYLSGEAGKSLGNTVKGRAY